MRDGSSNLPEVYGPLATMAPVGLSVQVKRMKNQVGWQATYPTLLIVDDDPENMALLLNHFEGSDFTVLVAEDGESGVQRAVYTLPDLILLDVLMAGIDGFETCRRLKADARTREIPIVFMTALADTASKQQGFRVGAVDYVTKPAEKGEVLARVRTHLAVHRLQNDLKAQNARLQQEVAERKRAEEELTRHREQLEELVAVRTAQVTRANEESRATQARLLRTLKFTEALLSAIPTPVFYKDVEGRYLGCNRAFTELMGVTSASIHGKTVYDIWPSEQAEMYHRMDLELMRQPALQVYEFEVKDKEGELRSVIFAKDCFTDENDRVAGIVGAFADISEHVRAEQALRESEKKYRRLFEDSGDAICITTGEGLFIDVNRAALELFCLTREEVLGGLKAGDLDVDPEAHRRLIGEVERQGTVRGFEAKLRKKDGTVIDCLLTASPMFSDGETVQGYQIIIRDVTARKMMEEELKKSAETIKLYAYSISHDLKSPAVGIQGLTRLLQKHYRNLLDERGRTYCDQLARTTGQLINLVEQINLYMNAKETPLRIERLDLKEILQMVKDELSPRLLSRGITWLEPEGMPEIKADRMALLRLLRNLADNALKYGGDHLTEISFDYHDSGGCHILSITDNGAGIRKECQKRIFNPFHRGVSDKNVEGTGLGLAIVREIADQHGGEVWVTSAPGKGTTFSISIPHNLQPSTNRDCAETRR